jgi:hypothetical protein
MSPKSDALPFAVDDAMIDRAAESLDIAGRLAGRNGLLLMDVACSPTKIIDPPLDYLAQAMVGLHRNIQDDDDLSDIEEALEYPLRAADQHGIDEACDIYRALLASRLRSVLARTDAHARLTDLHRAGEV